jgi:hypothetical protein
MRAMLLDLLRIAAPQRKAALEEQLELLDDDLKRDFSGPEQARAATPSAQGHGPRATLR